MKRIYLNEFQMHVYHIYLLQCKNKIIARKENVSYKCFQE